MMTLDEAIQHCLDKAKEHCDSSCGEDHFQLAVWLKELKRYRKIDGRN